MSELFANLPGKVPANAEADNEAVRLAKEAAAKATPPVAENKAPLTPPLVATPIVSAPVASPEAQVIASSNNGGSDSDPEYPSPDELALLKDRARLMGMSFSNNIGLEALKFKVRAKMDGEKDNTDADGVVLANPANDVHAELAPNVNAAPLPIPAAPEATKVESLREMMQRTQMYLIRVRITNLDPKKADLHGEIFTVANEYLGSVRKFIPYGEVTDGGYHIPKCIFDQLDERRFLSIKTRKNPRNGQVIVDQSWAKEFALDILPQLTQEELDKLAADQRASGSFNNQD